MCISKTCTKAFTLALGLCCAFGLIISPAARAQNAPRYRLDGDWPKMLPINWTIQAVTGMFADKNDHIWVLNRPRDLDKTENFAMLTRQPPNVAFRLQQYLNSTLKATFSSPGEFLRLCPAGPDLNTPSLRIKRETSG